MTTGTTTCNLYKRRTKPSVNSEKAGFFALGEAVKIIDVVIGDLYEGVKTWYELEGGFYSWSGGIDLNLNDPLLIKKNELDTLPAQSAIKTNKIEGRILISLISDINYELNVEYAAVMLISSTSDLVFATNPNQAGFFSFDDIPMDKYNLEANLIIDKSRFFGQEEIKITSIVDLIEIILELKPAELILK